MADNKLPSSPCQPATGTAKYLGIDYGTKRVGLALASQEIPLAFPIQPVTNTLAEKEIIDIINKERITHLVVGLPLNSANEETPICQKIRRFVRRLTRRHPIKVTFQDEYGTSEEAKTIAGSGAGNLDSKAAALILTDFLNAK